MNIKIKLPVKTVAMSDHVSTQFGRYAGHVLLTFNLVREGIQVSITRTTIMVQRNES
jgi:hypothetical protein